MCTMNIHAAGIYNGEELETIYIYNNRKIVKCWVFESFFVMEYYTAVKINEPDLYLLAYLNLQNMFTRKKTSCSK